MVPRSVTFFAFWAERETKNTASNVASFSVPKRLARKDVLGMLQFEWLFHSRKQRETDKNQHTSMKTKIQLPM